MEAVRMLSDKLLSLVRSVDVPVLPNHMDSATAFAIVIGLAFLVVVWTAVLMIAAALRPRQGVLLERPRGDAARAKGGRQRRAA